MLNKELQNILLFFWLIHRVISCKDFPFKQINCIFSFISSEMIKAFINGISLCIILQKNPETYFSLPSFSLAHWRLKIFIII